MPLGPSAEREELHLRDIQLRGYRRTDGLFDIEARLTDTKTYTFENQDRGRIPSGEPLHGMWMRMTVDEDLTIVACEAVTEHAPYSICPGGAKNFASLAGLRIGPGFLKAAMARVAGTLGCTHLRELLQQMATVAFQTSYPVRARRESERKPAERPPLLDTCYAFASEGPVARRLWPDLAKADADPDPAG